jgi:hypothetical protein
VGADDEQLRLDSGREESIRGWAANDLPDDVRAEVFLLGPGYLLLKASFCLDSPPKVPWRGSAGVDRQHLGAMKFRLRKGEVDRRIRSRGSVGSDQDHAGGVAARWPPVPADDDHAALTVRSDLRADRPHQQPCDCATASRAHDHHFRVAAVFTQCQRGGTGGQQRPYVHRSPGEHPRVAHSFGHDSVAGAAGAFPGRRGIR